VARDICPSDRRQVHVRITDLGLDLLRRIDEKMDGTEQRYKSLSQDEAAELSRLLDKLRG
jgi:DNA-binding MarR family transcriptional regulator